MAYRKMRWRKRYRCVAEVVDVKATDGGSNWSHRCTFPAHYMEPDRLGVLRRWCGHHAPSRKPPGRPPPWG